MLSLTVCIKHGLLPSCILAIILLLFCAMDLIQFKPVIITVPFLQRKINENPNAYLDAHINQADTDGQIFLNNNVQTGTLSLETKSSFTDVKTKDTSTRTQSQEKTVIIGIGTGRSGTLSVAKFLDQQTDSAVTHEWNTCKGLWWYEASFVKAKARYDSYIARRGTFVGDVALWNLPYVEYFLEFPNVKVVALKRVKNDTVKSFEKWFGGMRHFPWITDAQRRLTSYKDHKTYDNCYPKYQFSSSEPSITEGASRYWEDYYSQVEKLKDKYPDRLIVIDSYEILDNNKTKEDVLTWLGMKPPFKLTVPLTHPTRTKSEINAAKQTS